MQTNSPPRLAAPGAGLPRLELFAARRLFSLKRRVGNRASFSEQFRREQERIAALLADTPPSARARRVLIKRLRGLEDSSRHWSIWMTLDHLRICHDAFAVIISELAAGRVPSGAASTAAVKPSPDVDQAIEGRFEESCRLYEKTIADHGQLSAPPLYPHPWFGPLDAAGWHALAALHIGIHRRQIAAIRKGLAD